MNSLQKLTRHIPKYLLVFFVVIIVFNIVTYFFYPGIKEGHKSSNKKIKKLDERVERSVKNTVRGLMMHTSNTKDPHGRTLKKGSDVKPSDWVSVASDDTKKYLLSDKNKLVMESDYPQLL